MIISDVDSLTVSTDSGGNKQYLVRGAIDDAEGDFHFSSAYWEVSAQVETDGSLTVTTDLKERSV
jgi:hypothetical protein